MADALPLPAPTDHYRELFEQIGAVQLLVDPDSMRIVDANPAAEAFYGHPRQALRGMPVSSLNTLPQEEMGQAVRLAASMGGHYRGFPHRLSSGEIRLVEIYAGPLKLDGRVLLHEIIHDVTEQIQLERILAGTMAPRLPMPDPPGLSSRHRNVTEISLYSA